MNEALDAKICLNKRGVDSQKIGDSGSLLFGKRLVLTVGHPHDVRKLLRQDSHVDKLRAPPLDNDAPVDNHGVDGRIGGSKV
jgi:hypothetical protein